MAEQSGFFNAHYTGGEYDRVYLAENFARYFASFIGNGVFGGKASELKVRSKEVEDMSVRVLPGQAWINGYWYENTDDFSLTIDNADGVLKRVDLIVIRWNKAERIIKLAVKKGTSASNPIAPQLQRDENCYELKLARIVVRPGATKITQADIIDTRLGSGCGFVQGVVKQFDTTDFGEQIDSFIEQFTESNTIKMNNVIERLNEIAMDNDISGLAYDVEELKYNVELISGLYAETNRKIKAIEGLFTESEEYPGCFYRIISDTNETEWVNSPDELGVEYRTTERYKGQPVYKKIIYAASLPNNSTMSIDTQINALNIIFIEGRVLDTGDNIFHPIPFTLPNQTIPTCVISSIEYDGELLVYSAIDTSHCEGFFTIKYVKP